MNDPSVSSIVKSRAQRKNHAPEGAGFSAAVAGWPIADAKNRPPVPCLCRESPPRSDYRLKTSPRWAGNQRGNTMKFILMMNSPGRSYQIFEWPQKAIQAHIDFMRTFSKKLADAGELAGAEGLSSPEQAK